MIMSKRALSSQPPLPKIQVLWNMKKVIDNQLIEALADVHDENLRNIILLNANSLCELALEIGILTGKDQLKSEIKTWLDKPKIPDS